MDRDPREILSRKSQTSKEKKTEAEIEHGLVEIDSTSFKEEAKERPAHAFDFPIAVFVSVVTTASALWFAKVYLEAERSLLDTVVSRRTAAAGLVCMAAFSMAVVIVVPKQRPDRVSQLEASFWSVQLIWYLLAVLGMSASSIATQEAYDRWWVTCIVWSAYGLILTTALRPVTWIFGTPLFGF